MHILSITPNESSLMIVFTIIYCMAYGVWSRIWQNTSYVKVIFWIIIRLLDQKVPYAVRYESQLTVIGGDYVGYHSYLARHQAQIGVFIWYSLVPIIKSLSIYSYTAQTILENSDDFQRCAHRVNLIIFANILKQFLEHSTRSMFKPKIPFKMIESTLLNVGWKKIRDP